MEKESQDFQNDAEPRKLDSRAQDRKLAKTTAIIAIGNLSTKCANFLLLPFYTAYISREVYGTVDLLDTYVALLLPFVNLQLSQAAFAFLAKCRGETEREKEIVSNVCCLSLLLLLPFALLGGLACFLLGGGIPLYLLFAVPAEGMLAVCSNTARGLGKNGVYAASNFFSSASTLLMNVLLLAVFRAPSIYILFSYIAGPVIGGLYAIWGAELCQYLSFRRFRRESGRELLRFSVPMIPNEISWWVIQASDRTVLAVLVGISATGILAVATRFSAIYAAIYNIFYYAWAEQCLTLYRQEGGDAYLSAAIVRMWRIFACFSMLFIAGVSVLFHWMVNVQYHAAYGLVAIYGLAGFAKVMIGLTEPFLLRDNQTALISASIMVAGLLNVLVDLLLIGRIGPYAAPISSLAAYVSVSAWRVWVIRRRYFPIRLTLPVVLQVAAGLGFALFAFYQENLLLRWIALPLLILYCAYINRSEWKELWGMLRKRKTISRSQRGEAE